MSLLVLLGLQFCHLFRWTL